MTPQQFEDRWDHACRDELPSRFQTILFQICLETFKATLEVLKQMREKP